MKLEELEKEIQKYNKYDISVTDEHFILVCYNSNYKYKHNYNFKEIISMYHFIELTREYKIYNHEYDNEKNLFIYFY